MSQNLDTNGLSGYAKIYAEARKSGKDDASAHKAAQNWQASQSNTPTPSPFNYTSSASPVTGGGGGSGQTQTRQGHYNSSGGYYQGAPGQSDRDRTLEAIGYYRERGMTDELNKALQWANQHGYNTGQTQQGYFDPYKGPMGNYVGAPGQSDYDRTREAMEYYMRNGLTNNYIAALNYANQKGYDYSKANKPTVYITQDAYDFQKNLIAKDPKVAFMASDIRNPWVKVGQYAPAPFTNPITGEQGTGGDYFYRSPYGNVSYAIPDAGRQGSIARARAVGLPDISKNFVPIDKNTFWSALRMGADTNKAGELAAKEITFDDFRENIPTPKATMVGGVDTNPAKSSYDQDFQKTFADSARALGYGDDVIKQATPGIIMSPYGLTGYAAEYAASRDMGADDTAAHKIAGDLKDQTVPSWYDRNDPDNKMVTVTPEMVQQYTQQPNTATPTPSPAPAPGVIPPGTGGTQPQPGVVPAPFDGMWGDFMNWAQSLAPNQGAAGVQPTNYAEYQQNIANMLSPLLETQVTALNRSRDETLEAIDNDFARRGFYGHQDNLNKAAESVGRFGEAEAMLRANFLADVSRQAGPLYQAEIDRLRSDDNAWRQTMVNLGLAMMNGMIEQARFVRDDAYRNAVLARLIGLDTLDAFGQVK